MSLYLGVDSGGTKTECWLGDETSILARASTGTCKLTRVGQEVATERMQALLREVMGSARVRRGKVTKTCVGVAGFSMQEVREWAWMVVDRIVGGEVEVCGDDDIALDAAFRGGLGVLLIGGTGAVVMGRCSDGKRMTAGGWGPAVGDEGSGFWIGREAVRESLRSLDRGRSTKLLEAIRVAWGAADVGKLVAIANARPGPDFAALAPVVAYCEQDGDVVAGRVLTRAGVELADQVEVVWKRMLESGERQADLRYTGSVVEKIAHVRRGMARRIAQRCEGLRLVEGAVNSLEGALWRARGGVGRGESK